MREKRIDPFTSTAKLAQLTDIPGRRKTAASGSPIDQPVGGHAQLAALVRPAAMPRMALDPDDEVVIGAALAAKARVIDTRSET